MATINPFTEIRNLKGSTERSVQWYGRQIKRLPVNSRTPVNILSDKNHQVNRILPGSMYLFKYDPKHKETLPMWDMFPLVIPFRAVSGGFYGFNLHYISYMQRFKILGALHSFASDDSMTENNRIKISWNIVTSSSRLEALQTSVKHYLSTHVRSKFLRIDYNDWMTAAMLPVEKFIYKGTR